MGHFIPTTERTSAEGLARLFRDNVWKLHGLPDSIISDRGPQFTAGVMKELNRMLGIETKLSTAFHPQTDGQTERMNQELEQYLRMFIDHRQEQWPEWCNDKASRDDCLITLNVMRERRELDGVSRWIVLPTYTLFLFVYVYA